MRAHGCEQWERAEGVARLIEDSFERAKALRELATALAQAQQWERAENVWKEAEGVARSIEHSSGRAYALSELATALAWAQQWERAEGVTRSLENSYWRAMS